MKRKLLIRISISIFAVCICLFTVLVMHVGKVAIVNKNDHRIRQLSRIDFKQDIDQNQATQLKGYVASLSGVSGVFFNESTDILTYMYDPQVQDASIVFKNVINHFPYKAEKFKLNEDDMPKGCPAFAEKGLFSKFVLYCAALIYR